LNPKTTPTIEVILFFSVFQREKKFPKRQES